MFFRYFLLLNTRGNELVIRSARRVSRIAAPDQMLAHSLPVRWGGNLHLRLALDQKAGSGSGYRFAVPKVQELTGDDAKFRPGTKCSEIRVRLSTCCLSLQLQFAQSGQCSRANRTDNLLNACQSGAALPGIR